MKNNLNLKHALAILLAAAMLCACLTGCGSTDADAIPARPDDYVPYQAPYVTGEDDDAGYEMPEQAAQEDARASVEVSAAKSDAESPVETERTSVEVSAAKSDAESSAVTESQPVDMSSLEAVAVLGRLVGNWSPAHAGGPLYQIEMDGAGNPYGLDWEYMPTGRDVKSAGRTVYADYVNACDWSLVFDVEFYKNAFPMLALQYNYDDELLTRHFQTVGVHEGRQGSGDFNLAAYVANCGEEVRDAFGENWECYYFYYMLNHDAEKSVSTENAGGEYPLWLTVKMSRYQKAEFDAVNAYRAEAGVDPVTADPELMALACWRAWHDASTRTKAHDWMEENGDVLDGYMADMSVWHIAENTTKALNAVSSRDYMRVGLTAKCYYDSPRHYEAMIRENHLYFGCSELYYSAEHKMIAQFDMYTNEPSRPPRVCMP